jgi:hypothetical protein
MKTFDEAVVAVNVLEAPVAWVMAMHEATGASVEDLEDYARRRTLWEGVSSQRNEEYTGLLIDPQKLAGALRYLLGMEHLQ